jgi:hypothetical protein
VACSISKQKEHACLSVGSWPSSRYLSPVFNPGINKVLRLGSHGFPSVKNTRIRFEKIHRTGFSTQNGVERWYRQKGLHLSPSTAGVAVRPNYYS